jgi:predicted GIY-YIG superfamily endonuclease
MKWVVYDLVVDGVRVYVGCTGAQKARLKHHQKTTAACVKGELKMKIVSKHDNPWSAQLAEEKRIKRLNPILNDIHCKRGIGSMTDGERRVLRKDVPPNWRKGFNR